MSFFISFLKILQTLRFGEYAFDSVTFDTCIYPDLLAVVLFFLVFLFSSLSFARTCALEQEKLKVWKRPVSLPSLQKAGFQGLLLFEKKKKKKNILIIIIIIIIITFEERRT